MLFKLEFSFPQSMPTYPPTFPHLKSVFSTETLPKPKSYYKINFLILSLLKTKTIFSTIIIKYIYLKVPQILFLFHLPTTPNNYNYYSFYLFKLKIRQ